MSTLGEAQWIPDSPYREARTLKKESVLRKLVPQFSGNNLRLTDYYYLVITTDEQTPFDGDSELHPQLFKAEISNDDLVFRDHWPALRPQFGWTNYRQMASLIRKIERQLSVGSLFLPTYEMYDTHRSVFEQDDPPPPPGSDPPPPPPLEPPLWGRWIMEYRKTLCHLSCQGYSYAIRRWRNGGWDELERVEKKDMQKEKKMLAMLSSTVTAFLQLRSVECR